MAGKLHPPYIDGKIPAFCGTVLQVPFRNNRAVSMFDVDKIICKIKTVSTNEWVWTIEAQSWAPDLDTGEYYALFALDEPFRGREYTGSSENTITENGKIYAPYYEWLIVGLYYKIQIAYKDSNGQIGYFSDVGVTKYTSYPRITIDGLSSQGTNGSLYNYIGVYSQYAGDVAEKAYYYNFTIYDDKDNVFITTGTKTHNSSLDVSSYESHDEFYCNKELDPRKTYKIIYKVITNNNLVCESPPYLIMKKDTVKSSLNADLEAEYCYEDGYIKLSLIPKDTRYYSGNFAISRQSSKDNYETWDEICKFTLDKNFASAELFKDFTVEQGVAYRYSIQQYNTKGLYSSRIVSNILYADFEDMFLYDGKRQLKIRFNPNVSSFKNTILEQKTDTIGNKYPFIFRNGNVKYKELPISGLISYLMDEQEFFLDKKDLGYIEFEGTDLTSDNIRAERLFKLEVLEWLNNGEVKLFRSPTEGNYLVRLLNISLSPTAALGRMLHTFSCTAYEVGDIDFNTLNSYNLFPTPHMQDKAIRFSQIQLNNFTPIITSQTSPSLRTINNATKTSIFPQRKCYNARFEECSPDTIFGLQFESGVSQNIIEYIRIGETGTYEVNSYDNALLAVYPIWTPRITSEVAADRTMDGRLLYSYYEVATVDNFSSITDFEIYDVLSQWYGLHNNIINEIEDIRKTTGRFYWLKFTTRNIEEVYFDEDGKMYYDRSTLVEVPYDTILPTSVYADNRYEKKRYYNGQDLINVGKDRIYTHQEDPNIRYAIYSSAVNKTSYYWTEDKKDSWTGESGDVPVNRLYKFAINHVDYNVDLKTIGRYIITDLDSINVLSIGRMLMVDCYYQVSEKVYAVEETDPVLMNLRAAWLQAMEDYNTAVTSNDESFISQNQEFFDNLLDTANTAYTAYYNRLELLINAENTEEG